MPMNDKKYMVIDYANVTDAMVDAAIEEYRDNLRHTVTGTDKVILKYRGAKPTVFYGIDTYSQNQIHDILNPSDRLLGNDWTEPDGS